jgi:hypothetical protein
MLIIKSSIARRAAGLPAPLPYTYDELPLTAAERPAKGATDDYINDQLLSQLQQINIDDYGEGPSRRQPTPAGKRRA